VTERREEDQGPTRCLVIGGGLIGSHTATELIAGGHRVTVYSRSFSDRLTELAAGSPELDLVEGDLTSDAADLDDLVKPADVVFLLAGSSTPALSATDALASITGSLEPGLAVLESLRRSGTRRVVLASSGGTIYGKVEQVPTPEDAPLRPISLHGVNSLALETYTAFYAREHGLEPIVLRYSNVYGPGQRARHGQGVIAAWCAAISRGDPVELIGDTAARRDFIFATDAARATVAAAFAAPRPGTYNVGSGTSHSLAELITLLQEASGKKFDLHTQESRGIDVPHTELDCSRLAEEAGWRPSVGLAEGLARTWEWISQGNDPEGSPARPVATLKTE
jgi:UDP-glucose 4-epimerase